MPILRNRTTGQVVARNVSRADGFLERILGLIPRPAVGPDDGLWFEDCSAIHTVGMRDRIDVIFLDGKRRVLRIDRSVAQRRFAVTCRGACAVVELGESSIEGRDLLVGDQLVLE